MPEAAEGRVEQVEGRYVIRFERRFDRRIDQVWAALTQPERLKQWFGATEVELELVEGGSFVTRTTGPQELIDAMIAEGAGDPPFESRDTVLRVDPPRLFEHTFGGMPESIVRWELEPDGDGCRLRLAHIEPVDFDSRFAPRDMAGWHELLYLLERAVEARAGDSSSWSRQRWQKYRDDYARRMVR
jgi:uncharacterized protein YndB with AHSA1/START domain